LPLTPTLFVILTPNPNPVCNTLESCCTCLWTLHLTELLAPSTIKVCLP
jgi:hypothetical protein